MLWSFVAPRALSPLFPNDELLTYYGSFSYKILLSKSMSLHNRNQMKFSITKYKSSGPSASFCMIF